MVHAERQRQPNHDCAEDEQLERRAIENEPNAGPL